MSDATQGGALAPEGPLDPARLTAVIFAGASGAPAPGGAQNKNFFRLRGRPVVQAQVDLVRRLGVRRLVVVTEPTRHGELDLPEGAVTVPSSSSQSENFAAVRATVPFAPEDRWLVLFGDTPIVTEGVVRHFLEGCAAKPGDFHHGLVPHVFVEPFMDCFPRDRRGRHPFHLKEFRARLGCLSLVRPAAFDPAATRRAVNAVMAGRKQDPERGGLAGVVAARLRVFLGGLWFFGPRGAWMGLSAIVAHWLHARGFPRGARVFSSFVTLARLEDVATRLLGCPSRFVTCPFGGASLDVDGEVDLAVHERHGDQMLRMQALQERLVSRLVEPGLDFSEPSMAWLERVDPEAATEIRRHPEVYRVQRRILLREVHPGKAVDAA